MLSSRACSLRRPPDSPDEMDENLCTLPAGLTGDFTERSRARTAAMKPRVDGAEAFKLYDTFGLPRDFIEDACRDRGH